MAEVSATDIVFNGTSFYLVVGLVGVLWGSLIFLAKATVAAKDYQIRFIEAQLIICQAETKEWQKTAQAGDERLDRAVKVLAEAVAEVQARRRMS